MVRVTTLTLTSDTLLCTYTHTRPEENTLSRNLNHRLVISLEFVHCSRAVHFQILTFRLQWRTVTNEWQAELGWRDRWDCSFALSRWQNRCTHSLPCKSSSWERNTPTTVTAFSTLTAPRCGVSQHESKVSISRAPNTVQTCLWCINHCHLPHKPETMTLNSLVAIAFVCATMSLLTTDCSFFNHEPIKSKQNNGCVSNRLLTGRLVRCCTDRGACVNIPLLWHIYTNYLGHLKSRTSIYTCLKSWTAYFGLLDSTDRLQLLTLVSVSSSFVSYSTMWS